MANSRGSAAKKRRITSHGREFFDNEVEFGVLDYLFSEREHGIPVSNSDLKEKALEIARELNEEQPDPKFEQFRSSDGWLQRWKKRNRIALLKGTNESPKIPEDYGELIKGFVTDIKNKRRQHQYTLYNTGETAYLTLKFYCINTSYPMDNCKSGQHRPARQTPEKDVLCVNWPTGPSTVHSQGGASYFLPV